MKRAFSLVELLVVIGIIGILTGVLLSTFGGATESARAARCLVNLRSLANAATAFSMEEGQWYYYTQNKKGQLGYYPSAGSVSGGKLGNYQEYVGWISWLSEGIFKYGGISSPKFGDTIQNCPFFGTGDLKKDRWALEHGALWRAIGKTSDPYVCPTHVKNCHDANLRTPVFSYVMNMNFGCDFGNGKDYVHANPDEIPMSINVPKNGTLARADRVLMFAEIGCDPKKVNQSGGGCSPEHDCVLQFKATVAGERKGERWKGTGESMGFPHKGTGGRMFGHVAFADGHVEKFIRPPDKGGTMTKEQLTAALCEGMDIMQNGENYKVIENGTDVY